MLIVCVLDAAFALQSSPALSPVPRQAPNDAATSGKEGADTAKSNQNPTAQSGTSGETDNTTKPTNPPDNVRPVNTVQPISIREIPTVNVNGPWTANIFNFLLVTVAVGQGVLLYYTLKAIQRQGDIAHRQADIADRQLALYQPRLHVDGVRAAWFRDGQRPVFYVKIMNSGLIAAENVAVKMRVQLADKVVKYTKDQKITVPAQGSRECPIVSLDILNETLMAAFDNHRLPLRVTGHVIWNEKTIPYNYKYYPWPFDEPRPAKLRRFVPDDFDTQRAISINVEPGGIQLTGSLGTVLIKGDSGPTEPPTKPTAETPAEPPEEPTDKPK